jgi:2-polyprenyl-3-methyl-5-hydroxy-6-metoxy-1,4-benzoquinol methylase
MPSGALSSIGHVLHLVHTVPHARILDIGSGYGKFGLLCREYFNDKPQRIDAVEAWKPYIDKFPWLHCIYDNVYNLDGSQLTQEFLDNYDVVMMNDVIEHMEKDVALALLSRIKGYVVIATPRDFFEQEFENNPFEHHVSHWTPSDFEARAEVCFVTDDGCIYARLRKQE